jgi:pimeloyl-ACP methyl ester carboxylesterase
MQSKLTAWYDWPGSGIGAPSSVDYRGLSALDWRTSGAVEYLTDKIVQTYEQAYRNQIWSDSFLVVGHSMGGLVSAEAIARLSQGHPKIWKRVTLDTPRTGSPLANYLWIHQDDAVLLQPICSLDDVRFQFPEICNSASPFGGVTLKETFSLIGQPIDSAISALAIGSPALSYSTWSSVPAIYGQLSQSGSSASTVTFEFLSPNLTRKAQRAFGFEGVGVNLAERSNGWAPGYCTDFDGTCSFNSTAYCVDRIMAMCPGPSCSLGFVSHDGVVTVASQIYQAPTAIGLANTFHVGATERDDAIQLVSCAVARAGDIDACVAPASPLPRRALSSASDRWQPRIQTALAPLEQSTSATFGQAAVNVIPPPGCTPVGLLSSWDETSYFISVESPPFDLPIPPGSSGLEHFSYVVICQESSYAMGRYTVAVDAPNPSAVWMEQAAVVVGPHEATSLRVFGTVAGATVDLTRSAVILIGDENVASMLDGASVVGNAPGVTIGTATIGSQQAAFTVTVLDRIDGLFQDSFE